VRDSKGRFVKASGSELQPIAIDPDSVSHMASTIQAVPTSLTISQTHFQTTVAGSEFSWSQIIPGCDHSFDFKADWRRDDVAKNIQDAYGSIEFNVSGCMGYSASTVPVFAESSSLFAVPDALPELPPVCGLLPDDIPPLDPAVESVDHWMYADSLGF